MSDARQLLGMKGASGTTNIWKLRLQLMKPVTWIPLIWGVICGAAASGHYQWKLDHLLAAIACMVMSGPLLAGYTQTINDYYDCLLYTSPSPRDSALSRMPSSA